METWCMAHPWMTFFICMAAANAIGAPFYYWARRR